MEVYCTRPSCTKPENTIPDEYITERSGKEIRCANCGMPLILPGNFIPLEKLGNGGFGRTFTAKNLDFPYKIRVIKQLDPIITPRQILTQAMLNRIEEMFVREAIILDRLQHPQIFSFFYDEI
jgi:serine/threonine protein kinase